jgi:hypothetical protein
MSSRSRDADWKLIHSEIFCRRASVVAGEVSF